MSTITATRLEVTFARATGRRVLLRDVVLREDETGREHVVHAGFDTDYSSWPRVPAILFACLALVSAELGWHDAWTYGSALMALLVIPPPQRKTLMAGMGHDDAFRFGRLYGEPCGFLEANRFWYDIARSGVSPKTRCSFREAISGRVGLLFSYPVWRRYRAFDA